MNEDEKLQQQIADIALRYLKRTLGEIEQLRTCLDQARRGSSESFQVLGRLAHKIHGSGAMFGFDSVSERAYEIEQLAASDAPRVEALAASLAALEQEIRKQAQLRGVQ